MLKLQKSSFFLSVLLIVFAFLIMACDQGNGGTSMGCEDVKEVIVTLPSVEEGADEIDKYEIELIDAVSMDTLDQIEALPGESKASSILNTGAPIMIRATAIDEAGNAVAEGESTNLIGAEHDGLLCDFTININRDDGNNPTLDISVDCRFIEIMQKMVKFVSENFKEIVQVYVYVVKDTVEDITNIIEIFSGE